MEVENGLVHYLELNILRADLFAKKGEVRRAIALMEKNVEMAATEGYIRLFLDEGQNVVHLLLRLAKQPIVYQSPIATFLQHLLEAAQESYTSEKEDKLDGEKLPEALTQREIDILNCISQGMTNRQIGDRLGLSEGTVKVYNNQLFAKLGVRNRTQAIERAREAGILL